MEDNITFGLGYMPSIDRLSLPKGAYIDALNMMRDSAGNIVNEHGTNSALELALNSKISGVTRVGDDIVIASISQGVSSIGVLDINDTYTNITSDPALSFGDIRVQLESRIDYKGQRIIYIGGKGLKLRRLNLDDVPTEDFDKSTSLFLEYELPYLEGVDVLAGGSVPSGAYQFAGRLITASNNATSFGALSGVIPIGTGTEADGRKSVDGAEPQTPTANLISLKASNIDTSFEYFEPCVITYIGKSNQLQIRSLGRRAISDRSEITFSYSGTDDETADILEGELNLDSTYYESASYMTQKDNTLILGGLTEKVDNVDWQAVANTIVMKSVIHEVTRTEEVRVVRDDGVAFDDTSFDNANGASWTDDGTLGDFNDYKDPMIASKFRSYRRNEVYSFTFTPIFLGGRRGNSYHIPALTSAEAIALGATDDNLLNKVETTNYTYPNGYGALTNQLVRYHKMPSVLEEPFYTSVGDQEYIRMLGVSAQIMDSSNWKDTLSGYIIGREDRSGKETMLAQGIVKDFYLGQNTGSTYIPCPGHGGTIVRHTDSTDFTSWNQAHKSIFTFHSPDLQISPSPDYVPSKIRRIAQYNAKIEFRNSGTREVGTRMRSMLNTSPGIVLDDVVSLQDGLKYIKGESHSATDNQREGPDGTNLSRTLFDIKIEYRRMSECFALKSTTELPRERVFVEEFHDRNGETNYWYLESARSTKVDLYNIEVERIDYYGNVYGKKSLPINTVLFNRGSINPINDQILDISSTVSFGGDTFISKFAVVPKTTTSFRGSIGDNQTIPATDTAVYFMVESNNNYNYRHYNEADLDSTGSPSYYPKNRILMNYADGVVDLPVALGTASLYNKQYSAQNSLKPSYSKSIGEEVITEFANREVYSATSVEGEKFDAFRLFLVANYHDVPKQHGIITGIFAYGNDLYTHTERCLWRNFYNTLATQATSEGDIVLGNGGAFPRPSIPVVTVDGGYAGCKDISASADTPMGRYFFDAYRSKVYQFSDGLKEVSNPAIFEKLRAEAYGEDAVLGYDYGRKRLLISTNNLSLSYNPQFSSFDGRHSYKFDHFISRDINDYMMLDHRAHKFTDKKVGTYFDTVYNSSISIASFGIHSLSKQFTSVYTTLSAFKPENFQHIPFTFFDKFRAYSYERNTDMNIVKLINEYNTEFTEIGEVEVHKVNNRYRMALPPDVVVNPEIDIFDINNLLTNPAFTDDDRLFLPEMVDNHLILEFVLDNNIQRILKVNSFIINFEENNS